MDASVVFCVVCQTCTYYTTEAFLWDFVHRHLRTRFSPALLGVWDCFNQGLPARFPILKQIALKHQVSPQAVLA